MFRSSFLTALAGVGVLALAACTDRPAPVTSSETPSETSSAETPTLTAPANELTLERLFASPSLSGTSPRGVKFSPDGKRVTFLKGREDDQSRLDLWQFDVATGAQSMLVDSKILEPEEIELSEEEKALRERKRIAGSKGIVSYDWGTADMILVPIGGDLHLVTVPRLLKLGESFAGPPPKATSRQLTKTDTFEYDAKVSPLGNYVSFVRDGAVYAIELATGNETRLTPLAEPDKAISYGVAEFVAQEEMSRYTGYWWSPDEQFVAYTRVDESTVDIVPRFDIRAEDVAVIEQRYPRAGRPNAIVDLFVRTVGRSITIEIDWRREDWGPATDQYFARLNWATGSEFAFQRVDRDQKTLEHVWVSTMQGGKTEPFLREEQANWVNLSDDFAEIEPGVYAYTSEETGNRHLSIVQSGFEKMGLGGVLTSGDWSISALEAIEKETRTLFFTGFVDGPLERHLYKVKTSDSKPVRITEAGKSWAITMSPDGQSFVGTSSSPDQPSQTGLYKATGELIAWIEENALDETHPYAPYLADHTVPDYGTLKAEDGKDLYYSIQKPPGFDASKKYPVIVEVYGGPHVQTVTRNWERMSDQYLSRQGYIVFRLDNRGSSNRGKAFEDVIYRRTGGPEVRDQLVGVDWLKAQPFVDGDRIGIQGWSYGGYMTLMTLLQAPEGTFAAAVSGAPVTDWSLYDTFYTERYMDTPQDNADGYEASSVFPYVDNLSSPLLLIHGMADDNVTFDNTTRLMAELQEKGKHFELMTYPGQRHGIRGENLSVHLMRTRMAFLDRHLQGE